MKRFAEYTDIEIRTMAEEQVKLLIDRECALDGIALLPPMPEEPIKPDLSGVRKTAYKVGRGYSSEIYFETADQANNVLKTLRDNHARGYGYMSGETYLKAEEFSISSVEMLSEEDADKHGAALKQYETQKKEYDALKKSYDNIANDRSGINSEVWNRWLEQRDIVSHLVRLEAELVRYTELAEGNEKIGRKMLLEIWNKGNLTTAQNKALSEFSLRFVNEAVEA